MIAELMLGCQNVCTYFIMNRFLQAIAELEAGSDLKQQLRELYICGAKVGMQ